MRKNVNLSGNRSSIPMWYTAAAEYSQKKRNLDGAAFDRRNRFYGHGNILNPKQGSVVSTSRFGPPPITSGSSRSQVGSVAPTSRIVGGLSKYQGRNRSRSKSPTYVTRGSVATTPRSAEGLYRVPSRSRTSMRSSLRNPFISGVMPTKKSTTILHSRPKYRIPLHATTKDPLGKRLSFKETKPKVTKYSTNIESDEDNEDKVKVIPVGANSSHMPSNVVQLIMVEPNTRSNSPVQKIRGVRKDRMSNDIVSSQISESSRASQSSTQKEPEIVEHHLSNDQEFEDEIGTDQQEAAPEDVVREDPKDGSVDGVPKVEVQSENVAELEEEVNAPDVITNMDCPEVHIFQYYPNECPTQNSSGPNLSPMVSEECQCNNNGQNLITACSVTEEHYLSFEPNSELQPISDNCWNCGPQYGISHYMNPGCNGRQKNGLQSNISYPYSQSMMQTQPAARMSLNERNYSCNRPNCRQRQQQQQQQQHNYSNPQMQRNSGFNMLSSQQQQLQQQQRQQQQLQQQQLQQQQQQRGLTELLAQQLQQQMQQAQAQIKQVQMQLNNVCGCSKMSQRQSITLDPTAESKTREMPINDLSESVSASKELQLDTRTTNRCSEQFENPTVPCTAKPNNVTFCPQTASVCHPEWDNVTSSLTTGPTAMLSLGFSSRMPQSEVSQPTAAQNSSIFALQQQQQQFQPQQQCRSQQSHGMLPSQCPGNCYFNPCCRQRYAQMRFMMPRCWQRH